MTATDDLADPVATAIAAGLRYVSDDEPGIRRRRCGRGFTYVDPDGETVRGLERERIEELAIPPAWEEVWICPRPNGHLLATGRDDEGRKQYLYHPQWQEARSATKFSRMIAFGRALPAIRRRVRRDLRRDGWPREKLLALVVRVLDSTGIRVGSEKYRKVNGSFGVTTLRRKHLEVEGRAVRLSFPGKGGKRQEVALRDRRLAGLLQEVQELPGQELFRYREGGRWCGIGSEDVNEYLREIGGEPFTAKDFRTWRGTVAAIEAARETEPPGDAGEVEERVLEIVGSVAEELTNTREVCRQFYIHPLVLEGCASGELFRRIHSLEPPEIPELRAGERLLLALLDGGGGQVVT